MLPQNNYPPQAILQTQAPPVTPQRFPGSPLTRAFAPRPFASPSTPQIIRSHLTTNGSPHIAPRFQAPPLGSQQQTPGGPQPPTPMIQTLSDRKKQQIMISQSPMDPLSKLQAKNINKSKRLKLKERILSQKVRDLVPESQAYMDLLTFERKLDSTIMRKRLDIQEALKRPIKIKKKLRIFISNQFYPVKSQEQGSGDECGNAVAEWELRIEGKLSDDTKTDTNQTASATNAKHKRKFSSFFKSLVIELDKDLYGPDNHLVEWHRTPQTNETDGFQVKRPGDTNVKCTILMLLDYQPPQFKLEPRLARILGINIGTRPVIIQALWQYIKAQKLQNNHEKEIIDCDRHLQEIFKCDHMRFSDIPTKLHMLCMAPDPIVINHVINVEGTDQKKTSIYDIEVEIDDPVKENMRNFLYSSATMQEVTALDNKINENIEQLNTLRISREFYLNFSEDPQDFIHKWIVSQSRDLKTIKDSQSNPDEERYSTFYNEQWTDEAVSRYFFNKVQQRRGELEQVLGVRNN